MIEALRIWFLAHKRDLLWRRNPTPYQVWVSEVMLQQTQVAVVEGYYQRWMTQFPTIEALAAAPLEQVIKAWEGLGYYARVRHLYSGAQQVVAQWGGQLPQTREELATIKGVGPYTVGAILSFAFHQKAAAVDGNVLRVLTRYFAIDAPIDTTATKEHLWQIAEDLLPDVRPWEIVEGFIELGATVCQKAPKCGSCPLAARCAGRTRDPESYPRKAKRLLTIPLYRAVALIHHGGHYLVKQEPVGKIMAGLYQFPYCETEEQGIDATQQVAWIAEVLQLSVTCIRELEQASHSFTRYRCTLRPRLFEAVERSAVSGHTWVSDATLPQLAFSSGHRRILQRDLEALR